MCIDVEPDTRQIDPGVRAPWLGFEACHEFFNKLRPRLKSATGSPVHFNWFFRMDPQIARTYGSAGWVANRYASLISELKGAGDALGLNTHAWRWHETGSEWIGDLADQTWVDECVRTSFRAFRESFGESCLFFRFGDCWMNNATHALIEKLGARFDLTLEPRLRGGPLTKPLAGELADCDLVPLYPYRASRKDFRIPGSFLKRRLWTIPLSAGSTNWTADPSGSRRHDNNGHQGGFDSTLPFGGARFEGYLDVVDSESISGWAYDRSNPDAPVDVEILAGDLSLAAARAATFRPDLLEAGKGNGKHSFKVSVPPWMKDGTAHAIRAKVAGTEFYLSNSPKELKCNEGSESDEYLTLNLFIDTWLFCRIMDRILRGGATKHLAMVVRSEAGSDALQYSNMEQTFEHILRHPQIEQLAFVTPDQAINRAM